MKTPTVFISYSHKDEDWKDRVVKHLRVLQMQDLLDVWDDRRIEAGDEWRTEIERALNAASIAVLLIAANFLTSKFILDEEVPRLLERRAKQGVHVIPLIIKPCAWQQVKWLSPIQACPKDGRPLSAGNENQIDADLAALVNEIVTIVRRVPHVGAFHETPLPLPPDKISLAKLPSTNPDLFGRERELDALDAAWNSPTVIASLEGAKQSPSRDSEIASQKNARNDTRRVEKKSARTSGNREKDDWGDGVSSVGWRGEGIRKTDEPMNQLPNSPMSQ